MPYTYALRAIMPAPPAEIYKAWLDSRAHSAMTGAKARQSDKVGAAVMAWDGYITGHNVELVHGKRIVQTWRTTQFTEAHGDSVITVTLENAPQGTRLTLQHANVPDDQTSYEKGGWRANYFEPMRRYFKKTAIDRTGRTEIAARKKPTKKKAVGIKRSAAAKKARKKSGSKRAPSRN